MLPFSTILTSDIEKPYCFAKREGLNEFAGYVAVALVGFLTGYIAAVYGLKPYPFYLGIIFPIVGFLISLLLVKDTKEFTQLEKKLSKRWEKRWGK